MKRVVTCLAFASTLTLTGCPSPVRFEVERAIWRAAKAARRIPPVPIDEKGPRYLLPRYVPGPYAVGEDEIEVLDRRGHREYSRLVVEAKRREDDFAAPPADDWAMARDRFL